MIRRTLIPGDIVSISQPALSTFPADMLLLSGDAIVNESMLTGESVPVGKIPRQGPRDRKMEGQPRRNARMCEELLVCGTRVVRVRGSVSVDGSSAGTSTCVGCAHR